MAADPEPITGKILCGGVTLDWTGEWPPPEEIHVGDVNGRQSLVLRRRMYTVLEDEHPSVWPTAAYTLALS